MAEGYMEEQSNDHVDQTSVIKSNQDVSGSDTPSESDHAQIRTYCDTPLTSYSSKFFQFLGLCFLVGLIKYFSWSDLLELEDQILLRNHIPNEWRLDRGWRRARINYLMNEYNPVIPGYGELGKPVELKDKEKSIAMQEYNLFGYNAWLSDRISLNRSIPPNKLKECLDIKYDYEKLPDASVVIVFHNEALTVLLRTIWSIINRTPKNLLREIILIDDDSDHFGLTHILPDYIDSHFNYLARYKTEPNGEKTLIKEPLVRLIKIPRSGLIKARIVGAEAARGTVLVFLDAHCEVTSRWLEPMVARILEDRKVVVEPIIDTIKRITLEYMGKPEVPFLKGGFTWLGFHTWQVLPKDYYKDKPVSQPIPSPTMSGGLLAMDREYFFQIGAYDDRMMIWGGENIEMSFRVWQCGGRIEIHPCSKIGHIYRVKTMQDYNITVDWPTYNILRAFRTWTDDYIKYYYFHRPDLENKKVGFLKKRFQLREKLGCKSFKWYLDNVYDGKKFMYDKNAFGYGFIKNSATNLCIQGSIQELRLESPINIVKCLSEHDNSFNPQFLTYMRSGEIRNEISCILPVSFFSDEQAFGGDLDWDIDFETDKDQTRDDRVQVNNENIKGNYFLPCDSELNKISRWNHMETEIGSKKYILFNILDDLCLTTQFANIKKSSNKLYRTYCNISDPHQHWEFQHLTQNEVEIGQQKQGKRCFYQMRSTRTYRSLIGLKDSI